MLPNGYADDRLSNTTEVGDCTSVGPPKSTFVGYSKERSRIYVLQVDPAAGALRYHDPRHDRQHQTVERLQSVVEMHENRVQVYLNTPNPYKVLKVAAQGIPADDVVLDG